jgi:hypothetical protein
MGVVSDWKKQTSFSEPDNWVFASPQTDGAQPYSPGTLLSRSSAVCE